MPLGLTRKILQLLFMFISMRDCSGVCNCQLPSTQW